MSRLEWILGILLVLLLLVVVGLSAMLWRRPSLPELPGGTAVAQPPAPTSVYPGKTALLAYALAQRQAATWQSDAMLLGATATWRQGISESSLRQGAESWGYSFYSPSSGGTALVTVVGEQTNLSVGADPFTPAYPLAQAGGWVLDSQAAVGIFLDGGGTQFLSQATGVTMIMQLNTSTADGRVEWLLSLFASGDGRSLTMRLDATSGNVLEVTPLPET